MIVNWHATTAASFRNLLLVIHFFSSVTVNHGLQIPNTEFAVCLVVAEDFVDVELKTRKQVADFHHHKLHLNAETPDMCSHGGRVVTAGTVGLVAISYKDWYISL